jgi:ParB/RepB/Spo0J family partition protein
MSTINIKLSDIVESTFNPRKNFDPTAIQELSESILQHGLIQSILVRPQGKKYEIVCGARRFRASTLAKMQTISATVREMDDKEAFELAITENLQREDIHPLAECDALCAMKKFGYNVDEMAKRLGKSVQYARLRMQLHNLSDVYKDAFYQNKVLVSHATTISRLSPTAQESVFDSVYLNWKDENFDARKAGANIETVIKRATCELDTAPWNLDQKSVVKGAPACSECPLSSACSGKLFPSESKDVNRCLDPVCFKSKEEAHMNTIITEILEKPSVYGIFSPHSNSDYLQIAKDAGVAENKLLNKYNDSFTEISSPRKPDELNKPVLSVYYSEIPEYYDTKKEAKEAYDEDLVTFKEDTDEYKVDFEEYEKNMISHSKALEDKNAIWGVKLNSHNLGKRVLIVFTSSAKMNGNATQSELGEVEVLTENLSKIVARETRAKELDVAKRQDMLTSEYSEKLNIKGSTPLTEIETKTMLWLILDNCGWNNEEIYKSIGAKENRYDGTSNDSKALFEAYTPELLAYMVRKAMMAKYSSSIEPSNNQSMLLTMMLENLDPKKVREIDAELAIKKDKRIARFEERSKDFNFQLEALKKTVKKVSVEKKKVTTKKKGATKK